MLFDKNITNLISFTKNMNEEDKNKLKDMLLKISKLDDKKKNILFSLIYEEFNNQYNKLIDNNKTTMKQGSKSIKKK